MSKPDRAIDKLYVLFHKLNCHRFESERNVSFDADIFGTTEIDE